MIKLTIRLDDSIYDRLHIVAKENAISINKLISSILTKYISESNNNDNMKIINDKINAIIHKLENISKRQYKHMRISEQHFANFGYLSNADITEDKCLNEILNFKDTFND